MTCGSRAGSGAVSTERPVADFLSVRAKSTILQRILPPV